MTSHRLKNKLYIFLLPVLALFSGCRLHRPSEVLSPKEMETFLYDYHLSQGIISELPQDQKYKAQALTDWALEKNGISSEQLETSLIWYTRYPGEFAKIYKKLNRRIDAEYKESQNIISRMEKRSFSIGSGDSVSLWYPDSLIILNSSRYMSGLRMEQIGGESFLPCDTIVWNGTATIISPDTVNVSGLYMAMTLAYEDSISTMDTILTGSGSNGIRFSMVLDTVQSMKSVRFLAQYLEDSESNSRGMALISGIDMMRYHSNADTLALPDSASAFVEQADTL